MCTIKDDTRSRTYLPSGETKPGANINASVLLKTTIELSITSHETIHTIFWMEIRLLNMWSSSTRHNYLFIRTETRNHQKVFQETTNSRERSKFPARTRTEIAKSIKHTKFLLYSSDKMTFSTFSSFRIGLWVFWWNRMTMGWRGGWLRSREAEKTHKSTMKEKRSVAIIRCHH